jgi:histidinol-phosphate aminotransferase
MADVLSLARPELRALAPYIPGDYEPGTLRLNANESPWRAPGDLTERGLNRYPPPRPLELAAKLSRYYGVSERGILVTRGSSEAIDILIRGFCTAGKDAIIVCPPTFDMYRLYAEIQGARVLRVPLLRAEDCARDFGLDAAGVIAKLGTGVKLIFICTPNNPTGGVVAACDIEAVCEAAAGSALVVVDEAYQEFSDQPGLGRLQERFDHVVRLRTLSKFVSLAGVRCGALLAAPALIDFLGRVLPPYTFPTPSIELVRQALEQDSLALSRERIATLCSQRERLRRSLAELPDVEAVWPSAANFVFIRVADSERFVSRVRRAGILIRTFPNAPDLTNCVRITVGRPEDNDRLLNAVRS